MLDGATGRALVDAVDMVCFTGSVPTGRKVALAWRGRPLPPVTVSIGVAAYPVEADAASLLSVTDGALLAAKEGGRDRVVIAGNDRPGPTRSVRAAG